MNYKNLFSVHLNYIKYLLEKSYILHQDMKNPKESGSFVEEEIREFIQQLIPARFKVTHGYIVSAKNQEDEPIISPQIDLMIVDRMSSSSLFTLGKKNGMEVVPKESVAAIFEIKRTLKTSLQKALRHIEKISNVLEIKKNDDDKYVIGGMKIGNGITGGFCSNPLFGILGLSYEQNKADEITNKESNKNELEIITKLKTEGLDINLIATFSGILVALKNIETNLLDTGNPFPENPIWDFINTSKYETSIARIFGYLIGYLNSWNSKPININNYFFNNYIK
ncbi:MAG: DUF6602 domain-containing protein [Alphaproteobacteria bacterium]